jgi:hypothetical protein
MKLTIAFLCLLVGTASAQAGQYAAKCGHLEYPELKEQSKDDLIRSMCSDSTRVDINNKTMLDLVTLDPTESDAYGKEAKVCVVEVGRIERLLQNKYKVNTTGKFCENYFKPKRK